MSEAQAVEDGVLTPSARALESLRACVARSPADETAVTLLESWSAVATLGTRAEAPRTRRLDRRLQVRVVEAGRAGAFRPAALAAHELDLGVRCAMANARGGACVPSGASLSPADEGESGVALLHDPGVAALDGEAALALLRDWAGEGATLRLLWSESALTVVTSRGVARQLRATMVSLDVRCGRHAGAGSASAAARSLAALDAPSIVARARRRHAADGGAAEWTAPSAVVLAPEALAALIAALGTHALAAASWEEPHAFAPRSRGERVFAPALTVVDDGARAGGLPFPLDAAGALRRAAPLVVEGTLQGPLADPIEAARLGVPAWRTVPLLEDVAPEHLAALPGGVAEEDLLAAADDGVFVSALQPLDCWDAGALQLRAVARGAHRIERGALAAALPDAVWETTLPAVLAGIRALGNDPVVVAGERGSLGGTSAPAALVATSGTFRASR